MADLNQAYLAYIATLKAATPAITDVTTLLATDLPVVRAAHALPAELDDYNTLIKIHLSA